MCELLLNYWKTSIALSKVFKDGVPQFENKTQSINQNWNQHCSTVTSSNNRIQIRKQQQRKPIRVRLTHMYKSFALHAHGRSTMPLPLSAGKQQTRELTPSKIITITNNTYNYQRREVDGQWGLWNSPMEQPNIVSMGHAVTIYNNKWNNPLSHVYGT